MPPKPTSGGQERLDAMLTRGKMLLADFRPEEITDLIASVQAAIRGESKEDRIPVGGNPNQLGPMVAEIESETGHIFDSLVSPGDASLVHVPFRIAGPFQDELKKSVVEGLRVHAIGALRALQLYGKNNEYTLFHPRSSWPSDRAAELDKVRTAYIIGYIHHALNIGMKLFLKTLKHSGHLKKTAAPWNRTLDLAFRRIAEFWQVTDLEGYFDDGVLYDSLQTDAKVIALSEELGVALERKDIQKYTSAAQRAYILSNSPRDFKTVTGNFIVVRKFLDSPPLYTEYFNKKLTPPLSDEEAAFLKSAGASARSMPANTVDNILNSIIVSRRIIAALPQRLTALCENAGITLRMPITADNVGALLSGYDIRTYVMKTGSEARVWEYIESYVRGDMRHLHSDDRSLSFQERLARL